MIQIITNNIKKYENFTKNNFFISKIDAFQSLDNFNITVIDISDKSLWYNKGIQNNNINQYMDLRSINSAILKSEKSNVVILFPQNIEYYYSFKFEGYREVKKIKDMKNEFIRILDSNLIDMDYIGINYGTSYTKLGKNKLMADFSFINVSNDNILLKAENERDIVAIRNDKVVLTTLEIKSEDEAIEFLKIMFKDCFENKTTPPEWINKINFYTDKECKGKISEINREINDLKAKKGKLEDELKENDKYKTILYESGDILAKQVNDMLSKIFEYDMSQFKDTYEEDGCIKLEDITFIIETKGVNNEISGRNISDACNHLIVYEDKLEEKGITENVKCLFIVAYERNKPLDERTKIKNRIETIAKANNTLIIDTRILLNIFEDFLNNKINKEEIKEIFKNNKGILDYKSKE